MTGLLKPNWSLLFSGLVGLGFVYVFKDQINPWAWMHGEHYTWHNTIENISSFEPEMVIFNKTLRYILNDIFSIVVIHALFQNRQYTRFAVGLLLFGLLILLPSYFAMVYYMPEGYTSLVSSFHRIILNPVLMMMLIPYLYVMEREKQNKKGGQ